MAALYGGNAGRGFSRAISAAVLISTGAVVTAQTPGDGRSPDKSWNFYFTEVNGRIYRLTTNTPQEFSGRMAAEAESFIASFHAVSKPASK